MSGYTFQEVIQDFIQNKHGGFHFINTERQVMLSHDVYGDRAELTMVDFQGTEFDFSCLDDNLLITLQVHYQKGEWMELDTLQDFMSAMQDSNNILRMPRSNNIYQVGDMDTEDVPMSEIGNGVEIFVFDDE